jgi:MtN3 and saliva related transmembrane protein
MHWHENMIDMQNTAMDLTEITGLVAGIFTSASLVPQLVKMIREKTPTSISVWMIVILLAGLAIWIVYGFMKMDWPIILTNCFSFVVNLLILVLRFVYKKK